ncbi:MAG: DUF2723 domain-containing protein [Caldilineaceae bacterium]|nr:DUF2723 domain-containing protein [Caldilineaceae bacterium]MCB9162644.1 DUF2723 domain-containing protein [Caldilineaceae bacterium]
MVKFVPLNRGDRQIALLLFALVTAFYLRMAAPGLLGGDSGEFQFAAWNFGLAHPTGYPLYMLAGGLWQHLWALVGVGPARALNALSAVTGAAAVSALFLLMRRWLSGAVIISRAAALFAAIMLAVNPTMWSQSLIAEVYALHALFIVLIFLAAQSIALARAQDEPTGRRYVVLFLLVGLALTHHGMTLLLLPGLLLYLRVVDAGWWRNPGRVLAVLAALTLPLLLYLYIPLRSGPGASPWYHQRLGDGVLTLYDGSARAFVDFVTGRSISVGFLGPGAALARLGEAFTLWRIHYNWPGLVLLTVGLGVLIARRERGILALTVPFLVLQQLFNLFYAIDDILAYYIPLYVIGAIWIGFAAEFMAGGVERGLQAADSPKEQPHDGDAGPVEDADVAPAVDSSAALPSAATVADGTTADTPPALDDDAKREADSRQLYALIVFVVLMLLPLRLFNSYRSVLNQADVHTARAQWDAILAAQPPDDAILVSNDRNEIVPLFYLQYVEGRRPGSTGIFPLIKPGPEFADIGATLDTTLARAGAQPVYLVKPMDGLEVKFALEARTPPLVQVTGPAQTGAPGVSVRQPYGPLTFVGYDLTQEGDRWTVVLHWQVDAPLAADYTTSVQLFDADGAKLAQDDKRPGGAFYPTSLWKPGELLMDGHTLVSDGGAVPTELLVTMYAGPELTPLAAPLRLPLQP